MNANSAFAKMFMLLMRFSPVMLLYRTVFTRKMLYRVGKTYTVIFAIGLVRKPYIKAQLLSKQEAEKQLQQDQIQEILSKIDIKLSAYEQDYFVIVSTSANLENDEQLRDKQKSLFELNEQINKKLEINRQYFNDIKFLFLGDEQIYKIVQVNSTIVEFYQKQQQRRVQPMVYIMARQPDGKQRLLTTVPFKTELKSIINIISKHKARRFADSMQF